MFIGGKGKCVYDLYASNKVAYYKLDTLSFVLQYEMKMEMREREREEITRKVRIVSFKNNFLQFYIFNHVNM